MENYVGQIEDQLAKLKRSAASLVDDERLQSKIEAVQKSLDELRAANAERWGLLKAGVEIAWDDLVNTYQAVASVGESSTPEADAPTQPRGRA